MANLPIGTIYAEILPRLPAKFLLRCKCVCKSWKTLISSPEFINLHLRHSMSSDSNNILILNQHQHQHLGSIHSYHLDDSPGSSAVELPLPARINSPFIIGSCNGLLCIRARARHFDFDLGGYVMVLLNPSTGNSGKIPLENRLRWNNGYEKFGFGFDSVSDDYKIVRVVDTIIIPDTIIQVEGENFNDDIVNSERQVTVYSFKSKSWKVVEVTSLEDRMWDTIDDGVVIDNHLVHWMMWCSSEGEFGIRCFDLRNERWTDDLPLPIGFAAKHRHCSGGLGIVDGCLCLFPDMTGMLSDYMNVNVWVMKKYGVKESWMKVVAIPNFAFSMSSMVEDNNCYDDIIGQESSQISCYNVGKARISRFVRFSKAYSVDFRKAYICRGSLVNVAGATKLVPVVKSDVSFSYPANRAVRLVFA